MSIRSRYGLALLLLISYYAGFFVPLLTLTSSAPTDGAGVVPGMEFLQGMALFDYHYLSVGIFPFIFGSLATQFMRWQLPSFVESLGKLLGAEGVERGLAYVFASVMSLMSVLSIPEGRFEYHASITFVEMMFSVFLIDQLLQQMKWLKIASSPIMVMLGLNVLSSGYYSWHSINYDVLSINDLVLPVMLSVFSLAFVVWALSWTSRITLKRAVDMSGALSVKYIDLPVLKVGITPLIYTAFTLFPVMIFLEESNPLVVFADNPFWLMPAFLMMYFFSLKLGHFQLQPEQMSDYANKKGMVAYIGERRFASLSDTLNVLITENSIKTALFLLFMLFMQGAWIAMADPMVSGLQTVGGVSMIIAYNAIVDIKTHFKNHCLWRGI